MQGPSTVRLQRRRNELPPEHLLVEHKGGKRKFHGSVDEKARNLYIRQKQDDDKPKGQAEFAEAPGGSSVETPPQPSLETRRTFHLKQPSGQSTRSRKRKQDDEDLATVVEKRDKRQRKTDHESITTPSVHDIDVGSQGSTASAPLKRPGRGSAVNPRNKAASAQPANESVNARQRREMAALAEEMHQFALAELAKTPKPEIKSKPKLTPSRSRALHNKQTPSSPQSASQAKDVEDDTMMDSDGEYVYDTYVLAPAPQPAPTSIDANNPVEMTKTLAIPSDVGYLIITEDDEALWETYIHDLEGSDSEPTDEDDENAEDYYGADYPSDELASDDEFDRSGAAYGYRARRGSNDEQYDLDNDDDDEDEMTWSDEEEMRMMNPFAKKSSGGSRVEKQFAKYLDRKRAMGDDE